MIASLGNSLRLGPVVGEHEDLTLAPNQRDKHLYVCGATGTGKSKFLENLIRQDIESWPDSECGLLLLDPHGALCDDLVAWLAREKIKYPITLIDFRQDKWIAAYNLLRRRPDANAGVVVDNFVEAIAYVWGAVDTDKTPRFARWAKSILITLYTEGYSLVEALHLTDRVNKTVRRNMIANLQDGFAKQDWALVDTLRPQEFETELGSTINRLRRFLDNQTMRYMFGQVDVSLDLRKALDEGHIILVNLSREKSKISKENADLFATLLLTDLWAAAEERGKNKGKPFYVYLDEFQRFLIPTIAENLAEARGFGLHLTLANQFPRQLLNAGPNGQRIYDEVMENASSKVSFRMTAEENLIPIAKWLFMGVMNPDEVKHALYSTKVLAYQEAYRRSYTYMEAHTRGTAKTEGESDGYGSAGSTITPTGQGGEGSHTDSWNEVFTRMLTEVESESQSKSRGYTDTPTLMPIVGKELSSVQFRSLEEQLFRAMSVLFDQEQRQGVARLVGMKTPVSFFTPFVSTPYATPGLLELYCEALHKRLDFILPVAEAAKRLAERELRLRDEVKEDVAKAAEPPSYKRRLPRTKPPQGE